MLAVSLIAVRFGEAGTYLFSGISGRVSAARPVRALVDSESCEEEMPLKKHKRLNSEVDVVIHCCALKRVDSRLVYRVGEERWSCQMLVEPRWSSLVLSVHDSSATDSSKLQPCTESRLSEGQL